jgi:hypothetical protein
MTDTHTVMYTSHSTYCTSPVKMAEWTEDQTRIFCRILVDVHRQNPTNDQGFKKQQWNHIVTEFNRLTNASYSKDRLQNKYSGLKKDYQTFKALKECSGFGWDEVAKLPTAPPATWTAYLARHKDAAKFRTKTFLFFDEMQEILEGNVATGEFTLEHYETPITSSSSSATAMSQIFNIAATDPTVNNNNLHLEDESDDEASSALTNTTNAMVSNESSRKRKKSPTSDIAEGFQAYFKDKRSKINSATAIFNRKYSSRYDYASTVKILTMLCNETKAHIFESLSEVYQIQMIEEILSEY